MPTYDYVCDGCGHAFELFQQMTDPVLRKCPECGTLKLRRLVGSGAGIIFKGSGFYQTDYRSAAYRKSAEAEKKSAEGPKDGKDGKGGKGDKSVPQKPEAKTSPPAKKKNNKGSAGD